MRPTRSFIFRLSLASILFSVCLSSSGNAQAPDTMWTKLIPITGAYTARMIFETSDHGYIIGGYGDTINGLKSKGIYDFWAIKLDSLRNIQWTKMYGGSDYEYLATIRETTDGGYVMFGETQSNDGDVHNNHGSVDYWLLKLNANGDTVWTKTFGGTGADYGADLQLTNDGGYIVAGYATSNNGDVPANRGSLDYWTVKLNASGAIMWSKIYGGNRPDVCFKIKATNDSAFVMGGYSSSTTGDVYLNRGSNDYWMVKTKLNGDTLWTKTIGGSGSETFAAMDVDASGNIVVAGHSYSNDGDFLNNHGANDIAIAKLGPGGNLLWSKNFGGSGNEQPTGLLSVAGNNYIVLGFSNSNNGDVVGNHGNYDCWIFKLDSLGNILWSKTMGGSGSDNTWSNISQTADKGYVFVGSSVSNNGDLPASNVRSLWIVKLAPEQVVCNNTWTGTINSNWDHPGNWSCGKVPGITDDVIINNGTVIVNEDVTIKSLSLSPSVSFTIQQGVKFSVLQN